MRERSGGVFLTNPLNIPDTAAFYSVHMLSTLPGWLEDKAWLYGMIYTAGQCQWFYVRRTEPDVTKILSRVRDHTFSREVRTFFSAKDLRQLAQIEVKIWRGSRERYVKNKKWHWSVKVRHLDPNCLALIRSAIFFPMSSTGQRQVDLNINTNNKETKVYSLGRYSGHPCWRSDEGHFRCWAPC
jgi:hypothetical protein